MSKKVGVAVLHGIGRQGPDFADGLTAELTRFFAAELAMDVSTACEQLIIAPVHWDGVLRPLQSDLWRRVRQGGKLDWETFRHLLIDFAGDAIAYQPAPTGRKIYTEVHETIADVLSLLAEKAGEEAPLCIIAHSLGSVIASNYLYDLQVDSRKQLMPGTVRDKIGTTPLERGETLTLLYTLGSPLAIWSLRYHDFGLPIDLPSPKLADVHPALVREVEWLNFYDKDDVIGFPLKKLNERYEEVVTADVEVHVENLLTSWNPLSHTAYWRDKSVTKPIATGLARVWRVLNGQL